MAFVRRETPEEKKARVIEQSRGFRRVFARTRGPGAVKLALEAVLIFLAIAGSALAATTWDAIFGGDDLTEVATESSSPTERHARSTTSTLEPSTTPFATDAPKSSERQQVEFPEIIGRYRLVFVIVDGPCSADPEDNPPLDVTVTELTRSGDPYYPGKVRLDINEENAAGSSGTYDVDVINYGNTDHVDYELHVSIENGTVVGIFGKDADGVSLNLLLSALGCKFSYLGPWIGP